MSRAFLFRLMSVFARFSLVLLGAVALLSVSQANAQDEQGASGEPAQTNATPDTHGGYALLPSANSIMIGIDAKVAAMIDKGKQACAEDLAKYCSTVAPGEGRIAFCLIAHADKRTASCEAAMDDARGQAEEIINGLDQAIDICSSDIASHCAGTQPGEGRIAQCLLEQRESLSEGCGNIVDRLANVIFAPSQNVADSGASSASDSTQPPPQQAESSSPSVLDELDAKVAAMLEKGKQACAVDLEKYCSTVAPGEGRLAYCLIAHADKRTPSCAAAIDDARTQAENLINKIDQAVETCSPDIAQHCGGTEPGEGRIAQCLLEQREVLSEGCGHVVDKLANVIFPAVQNMADNAENPVENADTSPAPAQQASEADAVTPVLAALDDKVAAMLEKGKQACAVDLENYCSTVAPGEGRLAFCLIAHADKRTPSCAAAIDEARSRAESIINEIDQAAETCTPDIDTHCAGTEPGEGRIAQCLLEQRDVLSEGCGNVVDKLANMIFPPIQNVADDSGDVPADSGAAVEDTAQASSPNVLEELDAKVAAMVEKGSQGCAEDIKQYCANVAPGEGRIALCLAAHADKRTQSCEQALGEVGREADDIINEIDQAVETCAPDIAAQCAGTVPGEGRIAECLMQQRSTLSSDCGHVVDRLAEAIAAPQGSVADAENGNEQAEPVKAGAAPHPVLEALGAKVEAIIEKGKAGCAEDLRNYCSTVTPGEGRLAFCLIANADKRSEKCEQTLADAREQAEVLIDEVDNAISACSPDIAALCAGTQPGDGRIAQCLVGQRDALTEACGQVVDAVGKVVFTAHNKAAEAPQTTVTTGAIDENAEVDAPAAKPETKQVCRSVNVSITDWGKDATSNDARKLLGNKINSYAARHAAQEFAAKGATVTCKADVDLLVVGYFTCQARARVCWAEAANGSE